MSDIYPQIHSQYIGKEPVGMFHDTPIYPCDHMYKNRIGWTMTSPTPLEKVHMLERIENSKGPSTTEVDTYREPQVSAPVSMEEEYRLKGMEVKRLTITEARQRAQEGANIIWRPDRNITQDGAHALEVL